MTYDSCSGKQAYLQCSAVHLRTALETGHELHCTALTSLTDHCAALIPHAVHCTAQIAHCIDLLASAAAAAAAMSLPAQHCTAQMHCTGLVGPLAVVLRGKYLYHLSPLAGGSTQQHPSVRAAAAAGKCAADAGGCTAAAGPGKCCAAAGSCTAAAAAGGLLKAARCCLLDLRKPSKGSGLHTHTPHPITAFTLVWDRGVA